MLEGICVDYGRNILILFVFILFLSPGEVSASDTSSPDEAAEVWLKHVRRCLRKIFSFRADFVQEIKYKREHPKAEVFRGVVEVRRGGRYRLTYKEPQKRVVVCDGRTIWSFDRPSKTAITTSVDRTLLDEALGLLVGEETETAFMVRHLGGARIPEDGRAAIELLPRSKDALIAKVVVTLNKKCPCIERILVVDHTGAVMRIDLDRIETNVGIGKRRFIFRPPKGATIVNP
jgi:outer membrane lipoprotein-sorting protein